MRNHKKYFKPGELIEFNCEGFICKNKKLSEISKIKFFG
jgi:hypothetical protein